jgi:hypothetical protein
VGPISKVVVVVEDDTEYHVNYAEYVESDY